MTEDEKPLLEENTTEVEICHELASDSLNLHEAATEHHGRCNGDTQHSFIKKKTRDDGVQHLKNESKDTNTHSTSRSPYQRSNAFLSSVLKKESKS